MLLLSGIAVVVYTQINAVWGYDARIAILILSFIGTCLAAYISFTNPVTKWQQLRVAALAIESQIWIFRTRSGPYRTSGEEFDHSAEEMLGDFIQETKTNILEGADVKSTSFYSTAVSQNKHGQHDKNHPYFGSVDNYAKPTASKKQFFALRADKHNDHHDHVSKAKKKQAKEASKVDEQFNQKFLDKFKAIPHPKRPSLPMLGGLTSSPSKKSTGLELTSPNKPSIRRDTSQNSTNNNNTPNNNNHAFRDTNLSSYSDGDFFDFDNEEVDDNEPLHTEIDMTDHYKNLGNGVSLNAALEWLTKQDDEPDTRHRTFLNKHFEPLQPDLYIR